MAVFFSKYQFDAIVLCCVLLQNRLNILRRGSIVGNTQLPIGVNLIQHRHDAIPQELLRGVVNGHDDANRRLMGKGRNRLRHLPQIRCPGGVHCRPLLVSQEVRIDGGGKLGNICRCQPQFSLHFSRHFPNGIPPALGFRRFQKFSPSPPPTDGFYQGRFHLKPDDSQLPELGTLHGGDRLVELLDLELGLPQLLSNFPHLLLGVAFGFLKSGVELAVIFDRPP